MASMMDLLFLTIGRRICRPMFVLHIKGEMNWIPKLKNVNNLKFEIIIYSKLLFYSI